MAEGAAPPSDRRKLFPPIPPHSLSLCTVRLILRSPAMEEASAKQGHSPLQARRSLNITSVAAEPRWEIRGNHRDVSNRFRRSRLAVVGPSRSCFEAPAAVMVPASAGVAGPRLQTNHIIRVNPCSSVVDPTRSGSETPSAVAATAWSAAAAAATPDRAIASLREFRVFRGPASQCNEVPSPPDMTREGPVICGCFTRRLRQ